ncbi:MAG TPA: tetratricopeptide repeat protein [Bacteroidaceae bacterium]|nr:tetratricopeptide repeat protein [Bacteroidaceae bacterium]
MIKEKDVVLRKKQIFSLLLDSRLKEALELLRIQIDLSNNWHLKARFDELTIAYTYMLQYFRQGVPDTQRVALYKRLIKKTIILNDDTIQTILLNISNTLYYQTKRIFNNNTSNFDQFVPILENFSEMFPNNRASSESNLIESDYLKQLLSKHEKSIHSFFNTIWTSDTWNIDIKKSFLHIANSSKISPTDIALIISAVTLSLFERFDSQKYILLCDLSNHKEPLVSQRALTGLVLVTILHDHVLPYFSDSKRRLELLFESPNIETRLSEIQLLLLLCRETTKIDKKMREEIIPSMLKNPKLDLGIAEMTDPEDINPDWEEWIDKSNVKDKVMEISELQMEGADVYMSTFSNLKNYPFFKELPNWFRIFDFRQPNIQETFSQLELNRSVFGKALLVSSFFCNSDKYSFCFTFSQIPTAQRDMIIGQITEQNLDMSHDPQMSEIIPKDKLYGIIAKQYIQDLYRFFKLFSRRHEFYDPFKENLNYLNTKALNTISKRPETLKETAEFFLNKGYYDEAANSFMEIASTIKPDKTDYQLFQKAGYALQKTDQIELALEQYMIADILNPDNIWTIRHRAQCHRILKEPDKALELYLQAEIIQPDRLSLLLQIGECLVSLERYEEALTRFFKVEYLRPGSIKAWRAIAWCALLCDKTEQAQKYYDKLINEPQPSPQDYLNAGHAKWILKKASNAAILYKKCVDTEGFDKFQEYFNNDLPTLLKKGIITTDIPLMLDLLR